MKSSRNWFLGGLLAFLLLAGGAALVGQEPGPAPPEPPLPPDAPLPPGEFDADMEAWMDRPELRKELGITDAQAEQLRTLGRAAVKNHIRNRADWAVKRMELEELLEADKPDRTLVDKKLREIADLQYGMLKSRIETRLAVAGVLTPEQRTKLRGLVRQRLRAHLRGRGFGPEGFRGRPLDRGFGRPGPRPPRRGEGMPGAPPPPRPPDNP